MKLQRRTTGVLPQEDTEPKPSLIPYKGLMGMEDFPAFFRERYSPYAMRDTEDTQKLDEPKKPKKNPETIDKETE